jgi:hypothetical protein
VSLISFRLASQLIDQGAINMSDWLKETWQISEADFFSAANPSEKLHFLLRYAVLAPSGHNTQPWLFKISGDQVELYADRSQALPVVDPEDRELTISCGAALSHLCIALHHFDYAGMVETFPKTDNLDFLAG